MAFIVPHHTDASVYEMQAPQPASAYVVCQHPRNDYCEIRHAFSESEKLSFKAYAERELGYPVTITGISYIRYADILVIYVRKITQQPKDTE